MKFSNLNNYLIARFMFWYAAARILDGFTSLFRRNSQHHDHETRSAYCFHIQAVPSDLGKTGNKFHGVIIWNSVLSSNINLDVP